MGGDRQLLFKSRLSAFAVFQIDRLEMRPEAGTRSASTHPVVASPPSTTTVDPQTKPLAREARYRATPAISSGRPQRRIGVLPSIISLSSSAMASVILDGKSPGSMALPAI